jgi:hypothetical protein
MAGMQTGGSSKAWLFDPISVQELTPILSKLAVYDTYFEEENGETTLQIVLDQILEELPPELEEAVRLTFLAGLSYRSAGKTIGVDHKTVKARSERGVKALRKRLTDTVWLATLLKGMIPEGADIPDLQSPNKVFNILTDMNNKGITDEK